jgi:hypothetical protein
LAGDRVREIIEKIYGRDVPGLWGSHNADQLGPGIRGAGLDR